MRGGRGRASNSYIRTNTDTQKYNWLCHKPTSCPEENRSIVDLNRFTLCNASQGPSWWQSGLRPKSAAAGLLELWVRIPPGARMAVSCEFCLSLRRADHSSRGILPSVACVIESSIMRWSWCPLEAVAPRGGKNASCSYRANRQQACKHITSKWIMSASTTRQNYMTVLFQDSEPQVTCNYSSQIWTKFI